MDAKYNWIIDNAAVRIGINLAAFGVWLLAICAVLKF
jgi:hypothetical protein